LALVMLKTTLSSAVQPQVLNYANESKNKKQIVDGINQLPQVIGYDQRCHRLLPHSLFNYSQYVETHSNMPG
jgi:hypothetical protein